MFNASSTNTNLGSRMSSPLRLKLFSLPELPFASISELDLPYMSFLSHIMSNPFRAFCLY